jgi:DNA polymerase III subunit epsilon
MGEQEPTQPPEGDPVTDLSDAVVIDLEATGVDPATDRITSVALLRYDGAERDGLPFSCLVNPGRPIPLAVAELTGLTDATVADAPPFAAFAARLSALVSVRPLIGFGVSHFDLPLLAEEFERAGVGYTFGPVIDAGVIFKRHEPRTLAAAVRFYLGREFVGGHRAEADARAAGEVLAAQVARYGLGAETAEGLAAHGAYEHPRADPFGKLVWVGGVMCFNTHRNRHVPLSDDRGYAEWMLRSDFPLATRRVLRAELERLDALPPAPEGERLAEAVAVAMADGEPEIPF